MMGGEAVSTNAELAIAVARWSATESFGGGAAPIFHCLEVVGSPHSCRRGGTTATNGFTVVIGCGDRCHHLPPLAFLPSCAVDLGLVLVHRHDHACPSHCWIVA